MNTMLLTFFSRAICLVLIVGLGAPLYAQKAGEAPVRIIIRVDDMGCSHATNTGIMKTLEDGIATSVEIMAPTPWYPEAVAMLRERPDIDVGIHLTLTSEWTNIKWRPLTGPSGLTDEHGYFYPVIWANGNRPPGQALLEHDWQIEEIERELRAQIEMVQRDLPQLSHMSAHMGCMNINEETKALFVRLGKEYGLDIFEEEHNVQRMPGLGPKTLQPEQRVERFIEILKKLGPGTWLLVQHPADDLPEQQAIGHPNYEYVAQDRYADLRMLTDKRVRRVIEELGIELVSYGDLKEGR